MYSYSLSLSHFLLILKVSFGLRISGFARYGVFVLGSAWLENTAPVNVPDLEPGLEPHMPRKGSKWPVEPGPEPQCARNGRSGLARSRRWVAKCSNQLQNREMLDWCLSSHRGSAECSMGAARASSGATACSKRSARLPRGARSKWPLEECWLVFVYYRHHLLLGSTLLLACYGVHISIYISGSMSYSIFYDISLSIAMPLLLKSNRHGKVIMFYYIYDNIIMP